MVRCSVDKLSHSRKHPMKNIVFIACHMTLLFTCLYSANAKKIDVAITITASAQALMPKAPSKLPLLVSCTSTDTIEELKKRINTVTGMSVDQQQLSFMVAPCYLPDKKKLSNYDKCGDYTKPTGSMLELDVIKSADTKT